jgi:Rad3-related DNA helicase
LKQYGEYKNFHDCADGHCRKNGENKYDECLSKRWCPYFIQKEKAAAAKVCLMNFAGFLNHTAFGGENFGHRNLMIIDEAHNIEEQLLSFISTTLLESDFDNILKLPDFDYPSQYVEWIIANKIDLIYHTKAAQARTQEDPKAEDEYTRLIARLKAILEIVDIDKHWVCEFNEQPTRVSFKPIYVMNYARKHLFDLVDHVLIMSATILDVDVMRRSLGLNSDEVVALRLLSRFPVGNRPIYYMPATKVTGGQAQNIFEFVLSSACTSRPITG